MNGLTPMIFLFLYGGKMYVYRAKVFQIFVLLLLFTIFCSKAKDEYEHLVDVQKAKEQILEGTPDFEIKISTCEIVMDSIKHFIDTHEKEEWVIRATADHLKWNKLKTDFEREYLEKKSSEFQEFSYQNLAEFQNSKEELLHNSNDLKMGIQTCEEVIDSLRIFINIFENGKWVDAALADQSKWNRRKVDLERDYDYSKLMELQKASNELISNTFDYQVKIDACMAVEKAMQEYISKHGAGEDHKLLESSKTSWRQKKIKFEDDFKNLKERVYQRNKARAIEASNYRRTMSNIENMDLISRDEKKEGSKLIVDDVYSVRMRGAIIGCNIFKMEIHTSCYADMASNSIHDMGDVEVIE